jgi:hypothetical protein
LFHPHLDLITARLSLGYDAIFLSKLQDQKTAFGSCVLDRNTHKRFDQLLQNNFA